MRTEYHLQAPAAIQLIGSEGESAEFMLGEPSKLLLRGSDTAADQSYTSFSRLSFSRILKLGPFCDCMGSAGSVLAWPLCLTSRTAAGAQCKALTETYSAQSGRNDLWGVSTGDEGEEYGFDRGSRRSYELEVGDALGTLRSVFVQQVSRRSRLALSLIRASSKALLQLIRCSVPVILHGSR